MEMRRSTVEVSPAGWSKHPFLASHKFASNSFSKEQWSAYGYSEEAMCIASRANEFFLIEDAPGFSEMGHC